MDKQKFLGKLGAVKVWGDVARYYLNLVQFALIAFLFIRDMQYDRLTSILLISIFSVLLLVVVFLHVRYIMPKEFDYLNRRDRVKMETLKKVSQ